MWRKDGGGSKENSRRPGRRKHWKPTLIISAPKDHESGDSQKEKALGTSVIVLGLSPKTLILPSHHVLGALSMLGIWLAAALGSYLHILPREKGKLGRKSLGGIPCDLERHWGRNSGVYSPIGSRQRQRSAFP